MASTLERPAMTSPSNADVDALRPQHASQRAQARPITYPWWALVLAVLVSGNLLLAVVPFNMFPHDEGQYAQGAVRVLDGQLPHRDFDEMYTGGMTFWHAALFRVLKHEFLTLRYAFVVLTLPFAAMLFDISWRLTRSAGIGLINTIAGLFASIGMIHSPHSNCYMLLMAIGSAWALVRSAETNEATQRGKQLRFVALAGLFAGVSLLCKVTGVFAVAAGGIALTALSQPHHLPASRRNRSPLAVAISAVVVIAGFGLLAVVIGSHLTTNSTCYFIVGPAACLAALAVWLVNIDPKHFARVALCYGVGIAIPLVPFVGYYATAGAIDDLMHGLFVLPRLRMSSTASFPPPALRTAWPAIILLIATHPGLLNRYRKTAATALGCWATLVVLAMMLATKDTFRDWHLAAVVDGWRWFPVLLAIQLLVRVFRSKPGERARSLPALILVSQVIFFHLHQFPFAARPYGLFEIPLTILAWLTVTNATPAPASSSVEFTLRQQSAEPPAIPAAHIRIAAISVLLMTLFLTRYKIYGIFREYYRFDDANPPALVAVSGIKMWAYDADDYHDALAILNRLPQNSAIWAGPDAPEIYFLAKRANQTRTIYDFFADQSTYHDSIRELVQSGSVDAWIINRSPGFSAALPDTLVDELAHHATAETECGRFVVYTRSRENTTGAERSLHR